MTFLRRKSAWVMLLLLIILTILGYIMMPWVRSVKAYRTLSKTWFIGSDIHPANLYFEHEGIITNQDLVALSAVKPLLSDRTFPHLYLRYITDQDLERICSLKNIQEGACDVRIIDSNITSVGPLLRLSAADRMAYKNDTMDNRCKIVIINCPLISDEMVSGTLIRRGIGGRIGGR